MKELACKKCHRIVSKEEVCPVCKGTSFSAEWKGYVVVRDPEKSQIAKALKITQEGSYALRVR
ncbi:MAG: transcription elongation factor subunit Spt4 [Candidatus Hadarchaeales archaeon]